MLSSGGLITLERAFLHYKGSLVVIMKLFQMLKMDSVTDPEKVQGVRSNPYPQFLNIP